MQITSIKIDSVSRQLIAGWTFQSQSDLWQTNYCVFWNVHRSLQYSMPVSRSVMIKQDKAMRDFTDFEKDDINGKF